MKVKELLIADDEKALKKRTDVTARLFALAALTLAGSDDEESPARQLAALYLASLGHDDMEVWRTADLDEGEELEEVRCPRCDGRGHIESEDAAGFALVCGLCHGKRGISR